MAEVERTKNKIIVTCDCGAVIKISKSDEGEYKSTSTFKKKDIPKPSEKKVEKDPFFDDDDDED